jgi:heme exporter protein CcmD
MYFTSFEQLISMDGHGFYVWFCYACFVLLVVGNIWAAKHRQQRLVKQIKSQLRR